jgi:transcription antitermination factor NusG
LRLSRRSRLWWFVTGNSRRLPPFAFQQHIITHDQDGRMDEKPLSIGDAVIIVQGTYAGFAGTIDSKTADSAEVRISIFGRDRGVFRIPLAWIRRALPGEDTR